MAEYDMALVDEIRRRLDASYEEAYEGLTESSGDLLGALVAIERRRRKGRKGRSAELLDEALRLSEQGLLRGLRIRFGDRVLREVAVGRTPRASLLAGLLASVVNEFAVELVRDDPAGAEPSGSA